MKRASYRDAIDWIAQNDSGADDNAMDPMVVQELITSVLIADLFDVPTLKVGNDVVKRRIVLERAK